MYKHTVIPALVLSLALVHTATPKAKSQSQSLSGSIVSVGDGDTIRLKTNNETLTIRLACIDAPEMGQKPYGAASRQRLQQLLPVGHQVRVVPVDKDRYGRMVAKVFSGNLLVNVAMVQEGQAVVYRQYLQNCLDIRSVLLKVEQSAQSRNLGFWRQTTPVMPWDFRRAQGSGSLPSTTQSVPRPPSQPNSTGLPGCVRSDCDCSDFQSQSQAQQVFNAYPGDPFRLDRDRDGIACESLR